MPNNTTKLLITDKEAGLRLDVALTKFLSELTRSNLKTKKKNWWSIFRDKQPQIILNGGWHFSFLKKPELIQKKIKSYAHQEFNKDEFTNIDKIIERIKLNKDIFNRDYSYERIKIDNSFPEYISNNKDKFKDWIL